MLAKFYKIFNHSDTGRGETYNESLLIRDTHDWAMSEESKDMLLQTFIESIGVCLDEDLEDVLRDQDREQKMRTSVHDFAQHLMNHFFLPRESFFFLSQTHLSVHLIKT